MGVLTAVDKIKLYVKYLSFPENLREFYVKIELVSREADSAWRSAMLGFLYMKLGKAFCVGKYHENIYNIRHFDSHKGMLIEAYFELSEQYRKKYFRQICKTER